MPLNGEEGGKEGQNGVERSHREGAGREEEYMRGNFGIYNFLHA